MRTEVLWKEGWVTGVRTLMASVFSRKEKTESLIKSKRPRATQIEERGRTHSICLRETKLIGMGRKSIAKGNMGSVRVGSQFLTVDPLRKGQILKTPPFLGLPMGEVHKT